MPDAMPIVSPGTSPAALARARVCGLSRLSGGTSIGGLGPPGSRASESPPASPPPGQQVFEELADQLALGMVERRVPEFGAGRVRDGRRGIRLILVAGERLRP